MTKEEWCKAILHAVIDAGKGDRARLERIAEMLADAEILTREVAALGREYLGRTEPQP